MQQQCNFSFFFLRFSNFVFSFSALNSRRKKKSIILTFRDLRTNWYLGTGPSKNNFLDCFDKKKQNSLTVVILDTKTSKCYTMQKRFQTTKKVEISPKVDPKSIKNRLIIFTLNPRILNAITVYRYLCTCVSLYWGEGFKKERRRIAVEKLRTVMTQESSRVFKSCVMRISYEKKI